MLTAASLQFLYDLSQNNNRDWFEKNKKRYEAELKKPFEAAVAAIIEKVLPLEPQYGPITPKDCIFRIYRDTRFSKDKTPYKTNVAAAFVPKTSKSTSEAIAYPGYYLHVEYGGLWIGGGAYSLDKEPLQKVRTAIAQDPEAFRSLVSAPDFVKKYGELKGEKNKVLPPELKEAARAEPLIAHKQFYFMAEIENDPMIRSDFADFVLEYFKAGKSVNDYLRAAIG
jgi:uncharacterized protein (TIGR02453 family)